jgi:hypothetical protein
MAYYLIQIAYTAETWTALVKNPQNRLEAARPVRRQYRRRLVGVRGVRHCWHPSDAG